LIVSLIIHGYLKPENVLISKNESGNYTAQVADFGYSTAFSGHGYIQMPYSTGWTAPEWHHRGFSFSEAQKIDTYALGLLCLWFLCCNHQDSMEHLTPNDTLALALSWFDSQDQLCDFFRFTLARDPTERVSNFDQLINLLKSSRPTSVNAAEHWISAKSSTDFLRSYSPTEAVIVDLDLSVCTLTQPVPDLRD